MNELVYISLGRQPYRETWDLQKQLQKEMIANKRADPPIRSPHLLLQVEHPPVYTLGKSGDDKHLLLGDQRLAQIGATFERIDRGGDITFHGPGQVVLYPILDLDRIFTDLVRYLRTLETAVIATLADYRIEGRRVEGRTGVWVGPDERGPERKICAMGIRCSRWVTIHGLALNVATDLSYFDHIVPCGIRDAGVTSIQNELGESPAAEDVGGRVAMHLAAELGLKLSTNPTRDPLHVRQAFASGRSLSI